MSSDLHSKTVRAGIWSLIEAICLRGVQFIVGIILARLLFPEQFGLVGMLAIFMALAQAFLDSGFGYALIQKQDITEKDINSVFYFNILMGGVVAACLCALAPLVAQFYNQPILIPMLRALSSVLVINAFGMVQGILLTRAIDFKQQTKVTMIASLASGLVGIGMAYLGYGVWSLVCQQIASASFRTIFFWVLNSWRPALMMSLQSLRQMFGFGSRLLLSGLLNTLFDNIYLVIIGKLFSPSDLGYFTRAYNLQQLPLVTLSSMLSRVTLPVFSKLQNDPERMKRGMKKALAMAVLINFPLMIGMAVVARPLVVVLLSEKWIPCIPYFQLLCLVGIIFPVHLINLNVLQAMGRSDIFLRLEIIKKILIILSIAITFRWGILAMIYGQILTSIMSYFLNAYYNKTLIGYSILEQAVDILPYVLSALVMGGAVYLAGLLPLFHPFLKLLCQTLIGIITYVTTCKILNLDAYLELERMISQRLTSILSK